jgi:hypothetical protein
MKWLGHGLSEVRRVTHTTRDTHIGAQSFTQKSNIYLQCLNVFLLLGVLCTQVFNLCLRSVVLLLNSKMVLWQQYKKLVGGSSLSELFNLLAPLAVLSTHPSLVGHPPTAPSGFAQPPQSCPLAPKDLAGDVRNIKVCYIHFMASLVTDLKCPPALLYLLLLQHKALGLGVAGLASTSILLH